MSLGVMEMDIVEELKMRRWARENYVPKDKRAHTWHPVVHEEMEKKDYEGAAPLVSPKFVYRAR